MNRKSVDRPFVAGNMLLVLSMRTFFSNLLCIISTLYTKISKVVHICSSGSVLLTYHKGLWSSLLIWIGAAYVLLCSVGKWEFFTKGCLWALSIYPDCVHGNQGWFYPSSKCKQGRRSPEVVPS